MLRLVFVSVFLLGAVIGWLVVYFVRKYKEYNPKVLRDSMVLLLGGGCMDFLLSLIDKQVALYAFCCILNRLIYSLLPPLDLLINSCKDNGSQIYGSSQQI
mgnify:FL=1